LLEALESFLEAEILNFGLIPENSALLDTPFFLTILPGAIGRPDL